MKQVYSGWSGGDVGALIPFTAGTPGSDPVWPNAKALLGW